MPDNSSFFPHKTVAAIICEYNPFHNGHKYQIDTIRQNLKADFIICVMSGNFVQRGEPAIIDKYTRAEVALKCGADMVIELPVCFAVAASGDFAFGATSLIHRLGCVDYLCFGSEQTDLELFDLISDILIDEPLLFKRSLGDNLSEGLSFPAARAAALKDCILDNNSTISSALNSVIANGSIDEVIDTFLEAPNAALGLEYIISLKKLKSPVKPYIIKRIGAGYNELSSDPSSQYPSAAYIRKLICSSVFNKEITELKHKLSPLVPPFTLSKLIDGLKQGYPLLADDYSAALQYRLLDVYFSKTVDYIDYGDISPFISDRIKKNIYNYRGFNSFRDLLKTKNVTYSRISRELINLTLGIEKKDLIRFRETGALYAHVLGFRKDASELFAIIKKCVDSNKRLTSSFSNDTENDTWKDVENIVGIAVENIVGNDSSEFRLFTQLSEVSDILNHSIGSASPIETMLNYDMKATAFYDFTMHSRHSNHNVNQYQALMSQTKNDNPPEISRKVIIV